MKHNVPHRPLQIDATLHHQNTSPKQPQSNKKRSEKRKKTTALVVRLSPAEHDKIKKKAKKLGVTVSAFLRVQALENACADTLLTPTVDQKLLGKVSGQLGRIGSNVNQMAKRLNAGQQVAAMRKNLAVMQSAILKAVNMRVSRGN